MSLKAHLNQFEPILMRLLTLYEVERYSISVEVYLRIRKHKADDIIRGAGIAREKRKVDGTIKEPESVFGEPMR